MKKKAVGWHICLPESRGKKGSEVRRMQHRRGCPSSDEQWEELKPRRRVNWSFFGGSFVCLSGGHPLPLPSPLLGHCFGPLLVTPSPRLTSSHPFNNLCIDTDSSCHFLGLITSPPSSQWIFRFWSVLSISTLSFPFHLIQLHWFSVLYYKQILWTFFGPKTRH